MNTNENDENSATAPSEAGERPPEFGLELISKAMILLGVIILLTGLSFSMLAAPSQQAGWEWVWFNPDVGYLTSTFVISGILLAAGVFLYFLHLQFVKLYKIAEEVEAGAEFEEKDKRKS